MPKGGTAWVAIAKQLQLSQWDATKGGNYFIIKITYIEFMSNSRTQHLPPLSRQADSSPRAVEQLFVPRGVRLPKATKGWSMGVAPKGKH